MDKSPREHLADALEAKQLARKQLADARTASKRALAMILEIDRAAMDLQRQIDEAGRNPADVVQALAHGDVMEITSSVMSLSRQLEDKQAQIETLRTAQRQAEQEAEVRATSLDWAQRNVTRAAAVVIAAEANVDKLIEAANEAQELVLKRRAELMALSRVVDDTDAQRRVRDFLALPWAIEQLGDGWSKRPEAVRINAWFAALRQKADAEAPCLG